MLQTMASGQYCGKKKPHYCICGTPVVVETDHKPLVQLLESKEVEKVQLRIQRYRLRLMKYNVQIVHISEKHNEAADALSRYPTEAMQETILELETEAFVKMNIKSMKKYIGGIT